jgi:hypothetical protein
MLPFSACDDKTNNRNKEYSLLGFNILQFGSSPMFWSMLPPFSQLRINVKYGTRRSRWHI